MLVACKTLNKTYRIFILADFSLRCPSLASKLTTYFFEPPHDLALESNPTLIFKYIGFQLISYINSISGFLVEAIFDESPAIRSKGIKSLANLIEITPDFLKTNVILVLRENGLYLCFQGTLIKSLKSLFIDESVQVRDSAMEFLSKCLKKDTTLLDLFRDELLGRLSVIDSDRLFPSRVGV
jgi:hypothetical protein